MALEQIICSIFYFRRASDLDCSISSLLICIGSEYIQITLSGQAMDSKQNSEYCFWDAKSFQDTCPLVIYTLLAILVLILSLKRLIEFKKRTQLTQDTRYHACIKVYTLIVIWSLAYLAQNLYSVINFFRDLNVDPPREDISSYSKIYTILDKVPSFVIQTIFITVCIINYEGLNNKIQAKNFEINHKFYKKYIHFIYWARILMQVLGIASLIIFSSKEQIWQTSTINVIYELFDSVAISAILIYSLQRFINKGIQPNIIPEEVKYQIKREYFVMICSDVLGVIVNITFLLVFPLLTDKLKQINCMESVQGHWQFFFGHNIFGLMLQHLFPILWFLRMYNYRRGCSVTTQLSYQQSNPTQKHLIATQPQ